ncbi:replication protein A 70 kDa DNA-binding subunit E-like isoform X2 [Apium graveolens]|uniref:replication protein A 70 kDa DNA-binding subunit E-like isoform X2 n=1 Tax=Apium graveolens TaxID=4045 RepID=UPI003D78D4AF
MTMEGKQFKGFNMVLLDSRNSRIHAFVPAKCEDEHYMKLKVGNVYSISRFIYQQYKKDFKYQLVRGDYQLMFSNDTNIKKLDATDTEINDNAFDFFDHADLKNLAKQTAYLADVVGIIKIHRGIEDIVNKHGKPQKQAKFTISNGSSNVNLLGQLWSKIPKRYCRG